MKKTIFTFSFIVTAYILNAQVLYGTTSSGGNNNSGTICKLASATNTLTAAFRFDAADGETPLNSKLLLASDGKLYGMTGSGGSNGAGTIFLYDPAALTYTQLKDFDGTNGSYPNGSLVQASNGKLYGMTNGGGRNGYGVIFSYDPVTLTYIKLYDFDGTNGGTATGSLIQASNGKLYGMTNRGGSTNHGTIFSFDPATSSYTDLKDFHYDHNDGYWPTGSLIQASDGKLYGMTYFGGSNNYGIIFLYDPATAAYTKLKDFDGTDGGNPYGDLMLASDGKLYGMSLSGGKNNLGVIFSYSLVTSAYTKLIGFNFRNGSLPHGSLIQASDEKLYGMTMQGGINGAGVIFSYDPITSTYTKFKDFGNTNGAGPRGTLTQGPDGNLYGMTEHGGNVNKGVIFLYNPVSSAYIKLRDFGANNTGNNITDTLIKD